MIKNDTIRARIGGAALAAIALFAVSSSAFGQNVVPGKSNLQLVDKETIQPAPPISTYSFFPQVNTSMTGKNVKPDHKGPKNGLPEGPANNIFNGTASNSTTYIHGAKFPGISFTGSFPPDPSIAVGPDHVVQVVNTSISWYRKADGFQQFQQAMTPGAFLAGVPGVSNFTFDPKCFYDASSDRFMVVVLDVDFENEVSAIVVCVSDDSDPNGTWFRYRIDNTYEDEDGDLFWGDYPGWGFGDTYVTCATNLFPFTADKGAFAQLQVFRKDQLINNSEVFEFLFLDPSSFTFQIARSQGTSDGSTYGLTLASSTQVKVLKISDNFGTPTAFTKTVGIPGGGGGTSIASQGGILDGITGRMMDTSVSNGKMVGAFTVGINPNISNWGAVQWFEIDLTTMSPTTSPTLTQAGKLQSPNLFESYWMPAITINDKGVIALVCSFSTPTTNPTMIFAARKPSDPLGTLGAPITVASSTANSGGINRWGDYAGIGVDPNDEDIFWVCAELLAGAPGMWTTEIDNFEIQFNSTTVIPPSTLTPVIGAGLAGGVHSLATNNGDYYDQSSLGVPGRGMYSAYDLTFNTGFTNAEIDVLRFELSSQVSAGLAAGYVYMWSFEDNIFVPLRIAAIRTTERLEIFETLNNRGFVGPAGEVKIRLFTLQPVSKVGTLTPYILSTDLGQLVVNPVIDED